MTRPEYGSWKRTSRFTAATARRRIADDALVAMTLLIADSRAKEKDVQV